MWKRRRIGRESGRGSSEVICTSAPSTPSPSGVWASLAESATLDFLLSRLLSSDVEAFILRPNYYTESVVWQFHFGHDGHSPETEFLNEEFALLNIMRRSSAVTRRRLEAEMNVEKLDFSSSSSQPSQLDSVLWSWKHTRKSKVPVMFPTPKIKSISKQRGEIVVKHIVVVVCFIAGRGAQPF